ncbi:MAG: permease [Candidatus Aminicenantaceae bacterium]
MKKFFTSFNFILLLLVCNILVFISSRQKGLSIVLTAKNYLFEMFSILPPIIIIIGLFDVWMPKKVIERSMGRSSGLKGILVAIFMGTAAMGPLYVAFPVGISLIKKGASLFNTTIFLCVWASIKIPMILFEIKFLGPDFAGLRLALTIPSIIIISLLLTIILNRSHCYEKI